MMLSSLLTTIVGVLLLLLVSPIETQAFVPVPLSLEKKNPRARRRQQRRREYAFTSSAKTQLSLLPHNQFTTKQQPQPLLPLRPPRRRGRQGQKRRRRQQQQHYATAASALLPPSSTRTYLVRICFLRALAFVHFVAFGIALRQNKALIGDYDSLAPAKKVLDQAERRGREQRERRLQWRQDMAARRREQRDNQVSNSGGDGPKLSIWKRIQQAIGGSIDANPRLVWLREVLWDRSDRSGRPTTTLLWLAKDRDKLNQWLDGVALSGMALSTLILYQGAANVPLLFGLWLLQKSIMTVGGVFYGYGWEPQLAELSFHAMFMVPLWSLNPIPTLPLSPLVQWTTKWHLFRVMIGAGLIKLRSSDRKWKDLTAMNYFYETQPVPNPITRYMHWMPPAWHKFEVLMNHFVELVAPWLLIIPCLPTGLRRTGGIIQIVFQSVLISTGNLSFLNWLTMVPAIMCLDDGVVRGLFSRRQQFATWVAGGSNTMPLARKVVNVAFFGLIATLSVPVVRNLLSKNQTMNASYDPLRLVNTYGAFGTVGEEREEWIISASTDSENWKEYEFKVKPGDVDRPPRFISPYHYRLDWQMWLASNLRFPDRSPWIFKFLLKLLQSDPETIKLIRDDPFEQAHERPKYIRINAYKYEFHRPKKGEKSPPYWDRTFKRRIYPTMGLVSATDLESMVSRAEL